VSLQVSPQVVPQVSPQVVPQVGSKVSLQVGLKVSPQVSPQVGLKVGLKVVPQVGSKVVPQVAPQVGLKVSPQVATQVGLSVLLLASQKEVRDVVGICLFVHCARANSHSPALLLFYVAGQASRSRGARGRWVSGRETNPGETKRTQEQKLISTFFYGL
jgi:hypothetical protein